MTHSKTDSKPHSKSKPIIAIVLDSESGGADQYSKFPWYGIRHNYIQAVVNAGGLPLLLPHDMDLLPVFANDMDGLLIPGGNFDVSPALYGDTDTHDTVTLNETRTEFEMAILRRALLNDIPVLGICGGQQLLQVALGGKLIQHIPDAYAHVGADLLPHEQPNPRDQTSHGVSIYKDTLLHKIVGENSIQVNSAHHQAVDEAPVGVKINARAPDGVIEGIEATVQTFCLGVQWHPEFEITSADTKIFSAFIEAAQTYSQKSEPTDD